MVVETERHRQRYRQRQGYRQRETKSETEREKLQILKCYVYGMQVFVLYQDASYTIAF